MHVKEKPKLDDGGLLSSFSTIAILILLYGALQAAYAALTHHRHTPLRERSESGDRSAKLTLALADDLLSLNMTMQVALLTMRLAIAAVALLTLASPLAETLNGQLVLASVIVLIPVGLMLAIFGDLLPAAIGQVYADQLVAAITPPMRLLRLLLSPVVILLVFVQRMIAALTGAEKLAQAVTEEEIMTLVDVGQRGGTIEDDEKAMIYSVLQFNETLAREVMIPRPDITAIAIDEPLEVATKLFIDSGHSRIPVYEDEIDNIKGLLYAKDLLKLLATGKTDSTIRALMRPAYFVPETKRADLLFREMQTRKTHLAVVVDEYGGTAGLVTIEDLVEEIVGDIKDEYDVNEQAEFVKIDHDTYMVDGGMNLEDLNELLAIDLPTEETDSVGGFVYYMMGRVPNEGESIEHDDVQIRVESVDNRRIRKLHITRQVKREVEADTRHPLPIDNEKDPSSPSVSD